MGPGKWPGTGSRIWASPRAASVRTSGSGHAAKRAGGTVWDQRRVLGPYRPRGRFGGIGPVSPVRPAAAPAPAPATLAAARVGARLRVATVDPAHAHELAREGVLPGAILEVASRTPLGGPVIVVLGRVRLALSAHVAAGIAGEPVA